MNTPEQANVAPVKVGFHLVCASRGFGRCDLGGDHAPWDRLAAPQFPELGRGGDDDAEPAAADIPAVDADIDTIVELIATQLPQVLGMNDASDGGQVRSRSREPTRGNQDLGRGQDAH